MQRSYLLLKFWHPSQDIEPIKYKEAHIDNVTFFKLPTPKSSQQNLLHRFKENTKLSDILGTMDISR